MLPLELCKRGHLRVPENLKTNRSCKLCEKERRARARDLREPKAPRTHCANGHPENRDSRGQCKTCKREARKRWLKKHPEISRARRKRYLERHPEQVLKKSLQHKAWAKANPEKVRAYSKEYSKNYRKLHGNPPRTAEKNRRLKARRRARETGAGGSYTLQEEQTLRDFYGNRCVCCGRTEEELRLLGLRIVLDHVVPVSKGGTSFISNLQPLCHHEVKGVAGCNEAKCDFHDTDYRIEGLVGLA